MQRIERAQQPWRRQPGSRAVMTLGRRFGAVRDYLAHRDPESLEIASGWQFLPRPAAPIQNKLGAPAHRGGFGHGIHAANAGSAIIFRPKGSNG